VTLWKKTRRGVVLVVDRERVQFDFVRADVLRIKISQGGVFDASPTFAVVRDEFESCSFRVRKTSAGVHLKSDSLTAKIRFAPFHFDVFRADGSAVLRSVPGESYRFLNNNWRIRRRKHSDDTILGLGEKTQPFNHNGKCVSMWNTDVLGPDSDGSVRVREDLDSQYCPASDRFDPYYISINLHYHIPKGTPEQASASYIDCGYKLNYDFSNRSWYEIGGEGGQLTEYVFAGPSIRQIVRRFTDLTGRMAPPPLWALGHHQCRWHAYDEKDISRLARTYRRKDIPCDTLWLDIDYMDGYRVFTWDQSRYPHHTKLLKDLRSNGFRVITIIDPGVKVEPGYPVFDEAYERNLFCKTESGQLYVGQVWPGQTAFPDFVKEDVRHWWGQLNAEHVQSGLAGIWNDMNEPSTGAVPPHAMRFDRDGANYPHDRYRNQYALLMAMGTEMGLRDAMPELRTFILSRAGFAGIQRYAANWTGDNTATWEHLAMSIPMNANLGLSGQPFVGSDIGGFVGSSSGELLVRWYQYGVFQPFMRNHVCKGSDEHYPWSYGKGAEAIIREAVQLRYRLLPYIYSSFILSSESGDPIQRPLVYDWQHDPNCTSNDSEFLFGDHLLVAPVVKEGQTRRKLYLPPGEWLCFYSGVRVAGGQTIEVDAPLDHLPLFVRAGAVIPTIAPTLTTDGLYPETVDLNLFVPQADGSTSSILHEDDGLTDAWRRGAYRRTHFEVTRRGKRLKVAASSTGEGFPESRRRRFRFVFFGADLKPRIIANKSGEFTREFSID
jgi:alpha-glucosidase